MYNLKNYHRTGFICKYLLIENCKVFLHSHNREYTIIRYEVDLRNYSIHDLARLALNAVIEPHT